MSVQNVCIFTRDFENIVTELASDSQRVYDPFPLVERDTEIIIIQRPSWSDLRAIPPNMLSQAWQEMLFLCLGQSLQCYEMFLHCLVTSKNWDWVWDFYPTCWTQTNKLAWQSLTDASRRHKTPGSETRDFILHRNSRAWLLEFLPTSNPQLLRRCEEGQLACGCARTALHEKNSDSRELQSLIMGG